MGQVVKLFEQSYTENDIRISRNSVYPDNVWDLSAEHPNIKPNEVMFDFAKLAFSDGSNVCSEGNEAYLSIAKDYTYSLITDPVPSNPKITSLVKLQTHGFKRLLEYMRRNNIYRLSDITELDVDSIHEEVITEPHHRGDIVTNRTLHSRVRGFSYLEHQAAKMNDGVKVGLLDGHTETEWSRINASKVIGKFECTTVEMPDEVAKQLYTKALEELENSEKIFKAIEARKVFKGVRKYRKRTREDGSTYYEPRIIERFPYSEYGFIDHFDIYAHQNRILGAGYILVALFTGMRIHEVLRILKDGENFVNETVNYNGTEQQVSFITSKTTKLEAVPTQYKWQTLPFIEDVIGKIKLALSDAIRKDNPFLFAQKRTGTPHPMANSNMNHLLRGFVEHHQIKYNGELWHLASHQFRKKFARIMIRQGLGIKALQDQLKHYDIEMTKVYGDPNIYIELHKEKFELSKELYDELIQNNTPIIGGGAEEFQEMRKEFRGMTKDNREHFLESLPRKALIEQTDDGLCMYRPKKSLCGGDKSACRPADCNNSLIPADGKRKTLTWRKRENERLITFFKRDTIKTAHLVERNNEIDTLLSQLNSLDS